METERKRKKTAGGRKPASKKSGPKKARKPRARKTPAAAPPSRRKATRPRKSKKRDTGSSKRITVAQVILEREFGKTPRSGGGRVVLLGLDLGTRRTALAASRASEQIYISQDLWPTIMGTPKPGTPVTGTWRYVFGNDAVRQKENLELLCPVREGIVRDMELCRKFVVHMRSQVDPRGAENIWAVVSAPTDSTPEQWRRIRQVMLGVFERIFVVPEPYLAAVGMLRDGSFSSTGITVSSALQSLVVDVGLMSTRICLLQKEFPEKDDQIRLTRGGNFIDEQVLSAAQVYPNLQLTPELFRSFKEEQGVVPTQNEHLAKLGKSDSELFNLMIMLREACQQLLSVIVDGIQELVERYGSKSLSDIAEVVLLTGRSSRIPGLSLRLERLLEERGLGQLRVLVPADYKRLVARGALHIAEALSEEEWRTAEAEQRCTDHKPGREFFAEYEVEPAAEPGPKPVPESVAAPGAATTATPEPQQAGELPEKTEGAPSIPFFEEMDRIK